MRAGESLGVKGCLDFFFFLHMKIKHVCAAMGKSKRRERDIQKEKADGAREMRREDTVRLPGQE